MGSHDETREVCYKPLVLPGTVAIWDSGILPGCNLGFSTSEGIFRWFVSSI